MAGIKPSELANLDAQISAQLDLLRHSNTVEAEILDLLQAMRRELISKLAEGNLTEFSKTRLNKLLQESTAVIDGYYKRAQAILYPSLEQSAQVGATQAVAGLATELTASVPSRAILSSLVTNLLIEGAPSAAWWERQSQDTAFKFGNAVRQGIVLGETNEQIFKRVGEVTDLAGRNSRALVQTSIMQVASDARLKTIEANSDIYKGYRHLSTLDGHTTDICIARSNLEWTLDKEPIGHNLPFKAPPLHWNCLLGDSVVTSVNDVTGVSKRWYDGNAIIIKTASGRKLTCTPNHPILTNSGWVAAESLNVGCNVISNFDCQRIGLCDGDNNDIKTTIHDFTEAFLSSRQVLPMPVPVSAEDFHGDGICSKIAVVYSDSFLLSSDYSSFLKHFRKHNFSFGYSAALSLLKGFSSKLYAFSAENRATRFVVSGFGKFLSILKRGYSHSCELLFAWIAQLASFALNNFSQASDTNPEFVRNSSYTDTTSVNRYNGSYVNLVKNGCNSNVTFTHKFDTVFSKDALNDTLVNSELFSDGGTAYSGAIFVDDIISVDIINFSGHVYNLETVKGWYVANGIVTHNCRSVMMGIRRTFKELGLDLEEPIGRTRSSAEGQIDRETSFEEFLKRRTVEQQNEQLGKGRAELWRNGTITLRQLLDASGNPLTLEQLKNKYL